MSDGTGKTRNTFKHESLQDGKSIEAYLRAIAEGLAAGRLSLASDDREVELEPHDLLRFRVDARRGSYRSGLVIRVSWREDLPTDDLHHGALRVRPASR
jgi:amphi-Trp domain-containing protein